MKFFKKKGVAIAVMVLAIVLSSAYGIYKRPDVTVPEGGEKLDESLSTAVFEQYVVDQADILSSKTEDAVSLYNANWDQMAGSILAVVTVKTDGAETTEDLAWDWQPPTGRKRRHTGAGCRYRGLQSGGQWSVL